MYENPFNRKFGIEFEFNCSGMRRSQSFFEGFLADNNLDDFRIGHDGSEWEVKTPVLQGPTGFKRVKKFLDTILEGGARVSIRQDGLHVHHDAPEFYDPETGRANNEAIVRLVESWEQNQNQILKMVHSTRNNSWACPVWLNSDVQLIKDSPNRIFNFGRKNLNISALRRHGTIEIRLHEGTLNYEEVLSWVRFGQSFIHKALTDSESFAPTSSPVELLRDIKISRNASRFLSRKVVGTTVSYA